MPLTQTQLDHVSAFRDKMEAEYRGDSRFAGATRHDRADGSLLATRFTTAGNPQVWLEVAIRPQIPQVRIGILTDDRWKSEDFEEKIEESGDTMREFVEMGFEEAGLEWLEPPVEHFREDRKYFYFATALDLQNTEELSQPAVMNKARQMLDGYYHAFGKYLK